MSDDRVEGTENATQHDKRESDRFLDVLKRLNSKERNFLLQYALIEPPPKTPERRSLAPRFLSDLIERLAQIGIPGIAEAKDIYFAMDYHLEWIHAAVLVATQELLLSEGKRFATRAGKLKQRVEDVDLLVVLKRADGHLVLVLIEAKGIGSFGDKQLGSKLQRLADIRTAMSGTGTWLTSIMLLMAPGSKAESEFCCGFADDLRDTKIGFWPTGAKSNLIGMQLKDFPKDSLRIRTCQEDGTRAKSLADRSYEHWVIEPRYPEAKNR